MHVQRLRLGISLLSLWAKFCSEGLRVTKGVVGCSRTHGCLLRSCTLGYLKLYWIKESCWILLNPAESCLGIHIEHSVQGHHMTTSGLKVSALYWSRQSRERYANWSPGYHKTSIQNMQAFRLMYRKWNVLLVSPSFPFPSFILFLKARSVFS